MKFVFSNKEPQANDLKSRVFRRDEEGWWLTEDMDLIVTHDFLDSEEHYTLPNVIVLKDVKPGEPKFMRKRTRQVVSFHKLNSTKNLHEYHFAQ